MALRIVQLGTPRSADEGLRIGTVRRPPRGVPKAEFASRNYYDVWYPELSPETELMQQATQMLASLAGLVPGNAGDGSAGEESGAPR